MIAFGLVFAAIRLLLAFGVVSLEGHWLAGFTAIAHVYMGVLLHFWWVNRLKLVYVREQFPAKVRNDPSVLVYWVSEQPWQWHFFWFMNAVEVFSAIKSRM